MIVHVIVSLVTAISLNFIEICGQPIEPIRFEWNFGMIVIIAALAILANTVCCTLRTDAMKHIDATIVAVMMPFSAVVTGLVSVALGLDSLSDNFVIGGIIVLAASILSGLEDIKKKSLNTVFQKFHRLLPTEGVFILLAIAQRRRAYCGFKVFAEIRKA